MNSSASRGLGVALVSAAVLAAYFPVLRAGYIWDDNAVFQNPVVHTPSGIVSIWGNPRANPYEEHYWPLVYTVFWLQHQLWNAGPVTHHATNMLLHAVNASIVLLFLRRERIPGALPAAMLFALHPTKVESVAWVIELKDVLSGCFYLLSFWAGVEYLRTKAGAGRLWAGACLLFYLLGLLSKSVVVTLPAALFLYSWCRGQVNGRKLLPLLLSLGVVGGVVVGFDLWLVQYLNPNSMRIPLNLRALIVGQAFWFYLYKMFWPLELSAIYPLTLSGLRPDRLGPYLWTGFAVILHLALWLFRSRLGRTPLVGLLYFTLTLSPTLGFVWFTFMNHSLVADRFLYLSSLGIVIPLCAGATKLLKRYPHPAVKIVGAASAGLILLSLGALTCIRSEVFRNPQTLFSDVVRKNPEAVAAYFNLGDFEHFYGRYRSAAGFYERGVELQPWYSDGRAKYAEALLRAGLRAEAVRQAQIAMRLKPGSEASRRALMLALQFEEKTTGTAIVR